MVDSNRSWPEEAESELCSKHAVLILPFPLSLRLNTWQGKGHLTIFISSLTVSVFAARGVIFYNNSIVFYKLRCRCLSTV